MQAVILAAREGTRRRPHTEDRPTGMGESDGGPVLTQCFEQRAAPDANQSHLVDYAKAASIGPAPDAVDATPITDAHQREAGTHRRRRRNGRPSRPSNGGDSP